MNIQYNDKSIFHLTNQLMKQALCTTRLIAILFFLCFLSVRSTAQNILYSQGFENTVCDTWGYSGGNVNSELAHTGSNSARVGRSGESNTLIMSPVNVTGFTGLTLNVYHAVRSGSGPGMDTREGADILLSLNGGPFTPVGQVSGFGDANWPFTATQGGATSSSSGCTLFQCPDPLNYPIPAGTTTVQVKVISIGRNSSTCGVFNGDMTSGTASNYDRTDEGFFVDDIKITTTSPLPITLISATGTDAQSVCQGDPVVPITYSVAGPQPGVTGLPAGVNYSFVNGVLTITGTPTVSPGTYTYQIVPCPNTSSTPASGLQGTITVKGSPIFTLTSATGSDNQAVCVNSPLTSITYTITGANGNPTITGLPSGTVGIYVGGTYIIGGTPSVAGTYNYTITAIGDCGPKTKSGTITVGDKPSFTLTSASGSDNQTVCVNRAIIPITYTISGPGVANPPGITGLPAGVTGSYNPGTGTYTITGTPTTTGNASYTITANGTCGSNTQTGTITVNANPSFTLTSGNGTDNPTICINHAITPITYMVSGPGVTTPTVTGLPMGVTGVYNAGVYTISGTPTVSGSFPYTITTNGTCGPATAMGTITVNADPSFILTSGSGTDNQSVCISTAIVPITYTVSGAGVATPTVTGLPAGVTGAYNAGVYTISGTPTVSGSFPYVITATGTCNTTTQAGMLTVNAVPSFTLTSGSGTDNPTICINHAITSITYTVSGTGVTTPAVTGLPTGVTGVYNAGVYTISGTPTVSGSFPYTITTSGTCGPAMAMGTITVNANPSLTLTSASGTDNQSICITNVITPITYRVSGAGVTTPTVTGLPAGVTGMYNAGVYTISGTPTVSGNYPYTVTATGTCSVVAQATGNININTAPVVAAITGSNAVCVGAATTLSDATPGGVWSSLDPTKATVDNNGIVTGVAIGAATIQYSMTNTCGTTNMLHMLTVGDKPSVQPVTGTTSETCPGATFTVSDATPGGVWNSSNATIAIVDNNGIVTGVAGGNVTISYAVTNSCGTTTIPYAVIIDPQPSITVSPAQSICHPGDVATITATTDATSTVKWNNTGNTNNPSTVIPAATTTYNAVATSNKGCTNNASTTVTVQDFKVSLAANPNPVVAGRPLTLTTSSTLPYQVTSWQPSYLFPAQTAVSQTIPGDSTRQYTVTATSSAGCINTDTITVFVTTPEYDLFVPNFFTPNGDGKNDILYVYGTFIQSMQMHIYDQWGNMVFESKDQTLGWDGTVKGKQSPVGVYVYVLRVLQKDNTVINKKGSINIIR